MFRVIVAIVAGLLLCGQAPLRGFPPGTFSNRAALDGVAATYQGPGDVFSISTFAWYSCARAYNAAWASGGNNACLIQRASDNVQCTLKFATNGFVDLTTAGCNSNTQTVAQFCNATTCRVMTAYDQSGNARDVVQATFASAPILTLSDSPTGTLPVITCSGGTLILATGSTFSLAVPITYSAVVDVTTGGAQGGIIGAASGGQSMLGQGTVANKLALYSSTELDGSATDATWHAVNGLANGVSSAINVDGSETTGNAGSTGIATQAIRICRAFATQFNGKIAEAGFYGASTTSTNRNAINSNQHGVNGYNF